MPTTMTTTDANDPFGARSTLETRGGTVQVYRLDALAKKGIGQLDRLPYSIKVHRRAGGG